MNDLPTRCIDPVIKYCQECKWGYNIYPSWVETKEDLADCTFETVCTLGFDKGRLEDEPTEEELTSFEREHNWRFGRIIGVCDNGNS